MPNASDATKYWRFLLLPLGLLATALVNAVVRTIWEATAREGNMNLSIWGPLNAASSWLAAHWFGLLGWVLAGSLSAMIAFAYRADRRTRARRILENYYQRLLLLRGVLLDPATPTERLNAATTELNTLRGDLINMSGAVFTPATVVAFQASNIVLLGDADLLLPQDMPDRLQRRSVLAHVDPLLQAIHSKWRVY